MEKIRVLLIDDEELLTESMEIILSIKGSMNVVGTAKDGKEALTLLKHTAADIALVDLNMKGMGGIELIPILKEQYPMLKLLVLTTFYDDKYITDAISSGADGYLLKDSPEENIIKAIHQILDGQSILDSKVMQRLSKLMMNAGSNKRVASNEKTDNVKTQNAGFTKSNQGIAEKNSQAASLPKDLTGRELEICALIAEGYPNTRIAESLYISEGTVKNYMSSIYDKFDLHDRTQLAILLKNHSL